MAHIAHTLLFLVFITQATSRCLMSLRLTTTEYAAWCARQRHSARGHRRQTHDAFLRQIVTLARLCGWLVYYVPDSRRSPPGFPDLTLVGHRRLIFAEIKTGSGRLTVDQAQWIETLRSVEEQPLAEVWHQDKDWDHIVQLLQSRNSTSP